MARVGNRCWGCDLSLLKKRQRNNSEGHSQLETWQLDLYIIYCWLQCCFMGDDKSVNFFGLCVAENQYYCAVLIGGFMLKEKFALSRVLI